MGASNSLPADVCLDDFLNDLHAFYPGFEQQLENAYESCTGIGAGPDTIVEEDGLFYKDVEPVMRHFLFQMGLGELLPRVCDQSTGALKMSVIAPMLKAANIRLDVTKRLNVEDWKILTIAWVRRLQEEQASDLETWHNLLDRMQTDQEEKFHLSLQNFQSAYMDQVEEYHRAVETQHLREAEYKRQWENDQEMQTRFHDSQQEYVAHMNDLATKNFVGRSLMSQQTQFLDKLKQEVLLERLSQAVRLCRARNNRRPLNNALLTAADNGHCDFFIKMILSMSRYVKMPTPIGHSLVLLQ